MEGCVSYNRKSFELLDFLPSDMDAGLKSTINQYWHQRIAREILIALSSAEEIPMSQLRDQIGHSASTLHENIKRLQEVGLIEAEMSFKGNKQLLLRPRVIFVSDNPKVAAAFQKFFQGLFIDTNATKIVLAFLNENPDKFFTSAEISSRTNMPKTQVEIALSNLESPITRAYSTFYRSAPFEKQISYRIRK
ncbi:hypothetical protein COY28_03330 [Candidatus Woesearchaeota archaeon CG_4_10_14_0_2_um_filter_57_5]|nr:MAG: hypothetical protein AUJ68_00185 [Candidatus Woesearchaeota archaeon CG1_02_57_44]PIN68436.1 MAG: hypothetical protein COV94_04660 [Candidatus Woesearchaeota archaeon CG11_big_fil_rev_8_21_14_0_20_57_5]PIZ53731.1 MAG: hypothetical protein COY28_03330 [Candidatus Woesearchaeota archaeon CG_4_10_14_0_2_um_filter_57_5]